MIFGRIQHNFLPSFWRKTLEFQRRADCCVMDALNLRLVEEFGSSNYFNVSFGVQGFDSSEDVRGITS